MPDSINPHSIDAVTVQKLQALAPSHSTEDAAIIRQLFAEHKVFPKVTLAGDRALLLTNTLSVCGILPSLYTFFEDIKYLEPCAKAMRGLCGGKSTRTIHKSMVGSFFDPADRLIEHSRLEFHPCPAVSPSVYQHLAYVQLWLFALRHFPQLSNTAPRKSRARDKPIVLEPSPAIWHAFAKLAMILGFKTDDIINLRRSDPSNDDHAVEEICSSWEALGNRREAAPDVNFATSLALKTMERCGRPFEVDHYYDQAQLFLPKILEKPTLTGQNITTFYRKWNMLHVFFNLDSVSAI